MKRARVGLFQCCVSLSFSLRVCLMGAWPPFSHSFSHQTAKVCPHKNVLLIKALPPLSGGDNFTTAALRQSQTRKLFRLVDVDVVLIKKYTYIHI